MRTFLITVTVLVAPGFALAASQCAVPPGAPPTASLQPIQVAAAEPMPTGGLSIISAGEIERVPALKRISSRGAQLIDLGSEHGLRGVFARQGDSFQVFYVAPDGQALICGVMWEATGRNITRQQVTPIERRNPDRDDWRRVRLGRSCPYRSAASSSTVFSSPSRVAHGSC